MIALVDYRAGNLTSVRKALATIGAEVCVPASPSDLARSDAIIVPGVGHFGATSALGREWIEAVLNAVGEGRPLLGICLGMQWLYEGSEEAPALKGLGVLSGRCVRLIGDAEEDVRRKPDATTKTARIKVPHVGWNSLSMTHDAPIVAGVASGSQVYFTHSYVAPVTPFTVAVTDHGTPFAAVVQRGHVAGVQFHPEKSGAVGLTILRNFLAMC